MIHILKKRNFLLNLAIKEGELRFGDKRRNGKKYAEKTSSTQRFKALLTGGMTCW